MIRINCVYTKTGDKGSTSLGDGRSVLKSDMLVCAIGSVDELNAHIALCCHYVPITSNVLPCHDAVSEHGTIPSIQSLLSAIQNDLFDVGADLCVAESARKSLKITDNHIAQLERAIDYYNKPLPPLTSFVLQSGSKAASHLHVARTVCRRAEREVVKLSLTQTISSNVIIYLNRLSDLLFVLARYASEHEALWVPGQSA